MRIFTACKEMPRAPSGALSHHRKTPNRSSVFAFNRVHLKRLHRKHVRRRVRASATRAVKRKRNRSDTRSTTLPHPLRFERSKTAIERSTRRAAHPDAAFKHTPRIIASLKQKKANHRIDVPLDRARFRTDRRADRARSHDGPATRAVSQSESRRADR
jgi:hypothetical protein